MNEKIQELARKNTVVHTAMMHHQKGEMTYEQALEFAVFLLAEQSEIANKKLIECIERLPPQWQST